MKRLLFLLLFITVADTHTSEDTIKDFILEIERSINDTNSVDQVNLSQLYVNNTGSSPIDWFVKKITEEHVSLYGTWIPGNRNEGHLGSFQFNDEVIHNYQQYLEELYKEDEAYAYDYLIIPSSEEINFYIDDDNIYTDSEKFKISENFDTYLNCYYTKKDNYDNFIKRDKNLKYAYIYAPNLPYIFFSINLFNIGQHKNTFLTYLLNTSFPNDTLNLSSLVTTQELLTYPELLVNEVNGQGKTALQIAQEVLAEYKNLNNQQCIKYTEKIIEAIQNHPLYKGNSTCTTL